MVFSKKKKQDELLQEEIDELRKQINELKDEPTEREEVRTKKKRDVFVKEDVPVQTQEVIIDSETGETLTLIDAMVVLLNEVRELKEKL